MPLLGPPVSKELRTVPLYRIALVFCWFALTLAGCAADDSHSAGQQTGSDHKARKGIHG